MHVFRCKRRLCGSIHKRRLLVPIILIFTASCFILFNKQDVFEYLVDINLLTYNDTRLIKILYEKYLQPPSRKKYALHNSLIQDPSHWQAREIRKLLHNKTNGFFVESGAYDGEFFSNSLFFEKYMNWNGLLIEPDPIHFKRLLSRNRKCWTAQAGLSPDSSISKVHFSRNGWAGTILNYRMQEVNNEIISVQCFPLYSFLLALNVTKIDYFSLDVEGVEFEVLKSIPWDKVNITTISVEHQFLGSKKEDLIHYMKNLGYDLLTEFIVKNVTARIDYIFYHPKLLPAKLD